MPMNGRQPRQPRQPHRRLREAGWHVGLPRSDRVYLNVPFAAKDAAKAAGAVWDADMKKWFVSKNHDLRVFQKWAPREAAADRLYLNVPFADKDAAKACGAMWDPAMKQWFVLHGHNLSGLSRWLPAGMVAFPAKVTAFTPMVYTKPAPSPDVIDREQPEERLFPTVKPRVVLCGKCRKPFLPHKGQVVCC